MKVTFKNTVSVGKADRMIYGHFLEHFHTQVYGGVYDPSSKFADEDGFRTDVLEALRKIKTPIIRWPGGCFVSAYKWYYGVGKKRVPTFDKAWRVEDSNEFGTDEFVKLCRKLGCEPYICTNAGTGTAEEMSDWVEYCNLKDMGIFAKERIANGYPEPYNVKYWSIGNENWGGHEMGAKDEKEWGRLVCESAKMMLRVDPTIELSAATIENLDWNINLLRQAGKYLDLVSTHKYWERGIKGKEPSDYNTVILKTGGDITDRLDRVRAYLVSLGLEKKIKIAYDEWNYRGWYHPNVIGISRSFKENYNEEFYRENVIKPRNDNDVNSVYTMADAVFSACFLNACLKNCDLVKMACFSPVVNTRGAIYTYEDGIVLRPTYFVFELYANLLKDTVLSTWNEDVPTITGILQDPVKGDAERTVDTVDIVVTYGGNGEYAIAAVNKDPENEQTVDLTSIGDKLTEMRMHTLNGVSVDSYNDVGRTEVGISVSERMPFNGKITLPPHSVNVIELK